MPLPHFLALELAILLGTSSGSAHPAVLGVVVGANRVHANSAEVSTGATVYDGDKFATEEEGLLVLRGDAMTLELVEESALVVRGKTNGAQGTEAELIKGTLIFSTERAAALGIAALGAHMEPSADRRTVAQITIVEPKELRIYARRGSLQFSYRGEMETIAEGSAFRVILDPSEDQPRKTETIKPGRQHKRFLLVAIGAGMAGGSVLAYERQHHHRRVESPDRP